MTEFYTDLLKAQKEIEAVSKDGVNPFFKSDYTTLNATILACKETLNANNIIVLQPIESDENGVYVATTLIHTNGERLTSKMRITAVKSNDPQAQGSAITYARRYALKAMLCMSDSDDDAEKAMERKPKILVKDNQEKIEQEPTGLRSKCQTCGAEMIEKSGNTNGKAWTGLFCPNAKKGLPGHKPVWL